MDTHEFVADARKILPLQPIKPIMDPCQIGSTPLLVAPGADEDRTLLRQWASRDDDEPGSEKDLKWRLNAGMMVLRPDLHPKPRPCLLCDGWTDGHAFTAVILNPEWNGVGHAVCDRCVQKYRPGLYVAMIAGRETGAGTEEPIPEPEPEPEPSLVIPIKRPDPSDDVSDFADLPF